MDDARSEKGRLQGRMMGGVAGGDEDEGEDSRARRFRDPYVCLMVAMDERVQGFEIDSRDATRLFAFIDAYESHDVHGRFLSGIAHP